MTRFAFRGLLAGFRFRSGMPLPNEETESKLHLKHLDGEQG